MTRKRKNREMSMRKGKRGGGEGGGMANTNQAQLLVIRTEEGIMG